MGVEPDLYSGNDLLSHTHVARAPRPRKGCESKFPLRANQMSHFDCAVVTDGIEVSGQSYGSKSKSKVNNNGKVNGSGRGARSTHIHLMSQTLLQGKYAYRRRLPHYQKDDRAVFVTFCCGWLDFLPETVRDIVLRHCLHDQGTKAAIHAVVVMPDHAHLLLTPLRDLDGNLYSLVEILQGIKSASAHRLNKVLGRAGPVWQEESLDHVPRSDESFSEKLEYIRQNPVRRGLVVRPEDYRWLWVE